MSLMKCNGVIIDKSVSFCRLGSGSRRSFFSRLSSFCSAAAFGLRNLGAMVVADKTCLRASFGVRNRPAFRLGEPELTMAKHEWQLMLMFTRL